MQLQTIKNQYDNVMKPLNLNDKAFEYIYNIIKNPKLVSNKNDIPQWKFCTVNGELRCTENMNSTNILILDFDDKGYSFQEFENKFREYEYILHTSYSYDGTNSKFRVLLFLDKDYIISKLFFKNTQNKSYSPYHILLDYFDHVDPASFVKAQFFKIPAIKDQTAPYYYNIHKGNKFNLFDIQCYMNAYNNCEIEYEKNKYFESVKWQIQNGSHKDLTKAIEFVKAKMEEAPEGMRHNIIFGLASWFSKCGGDYITFSQFRPSWADKKYEHQIKRLEREWNKIGR